MDQRDKLGLLDDALQQVWARLELDIAYAERVEPVGPRDDEIHFTFNFSEEDTVDRLIRAARRTLASFGPEYWLPDDHPQAADFRQSGHLAFKVRKCLIRSHLYWGVSFCLCEADEGYSLIEDTQA